MSGDTGEALSDIEGLKNAVRAARGKTDDQQIIILQRPSNGGEKKLNSIIQALAAFAFATLLSLVLWQMQRVIDKVDGLNDRLIRVETKVGVQP